MVAWLLLINDLLVYLSWPLGEHRGHERGPCGSIVLQRNDQLDFFKCKLNEVQLEMKIRSPKQQCKQLTLYFTEIIQLLAQLWIVFGTRIEVVFQILRVIDDIYSETFCNNVSFVYSIYINKQ